MLGEKKTRGVGIEVRAFPPLSLSLFSSPFFSRSLSLRCTPISKRLEQAMKNVTVLTEDRAFAIFFRPHLWGFERSRAPNPGNLPSKAKKKNAKARGSAGAGGGGLGAAGKTD